MFTLSRMNAPDRSLEGVWEHREEVVYPQIFGPLSRGTFALTPKQFAGPFCCTEIDPRWLHYGVLEYGPTSARSSWIYVTSGASNPWEQDPDEYSSAEVLFFLCCVLVAGLYGAATASRKILLVQALPAAVGLALVLLS